MRAAAVKRALKAKASPERARKSQSFFKTGPGEYGAGDRFIGVVVPEQRAIARTFETLSTPEIEVLLHSPVHEHRLTGIFILMRQYKRCRTLSEKKRVVRFLQKNVRALNNWDLVDTAVPHILGPFAVEVGSELTRYDRYLRSRDLWKRRIAILVAGCFAKHGEYEVLLRYAAVLLNDEEDLIHKATGWMLREAGKQDVGVLRGFLDTHAHRMPRTMLRYALERLPTSLRNAYMRRRSQLPAP